MRMASTDHCCHCIFPSWPSNNGYLAPMQGSHFSHELQAACGYWESVTHSNIFQGSTLLIKYWLARCSVFAGVSTLRHKPCDYWIWRSSNCWHFHSKSLHMIARDWCCAMPWCTGCIYWCFAYTLHHIGVRGVKVCSAKHRHRLWFAPT